jgi:imidazoleglycerol-phosphate dehydratase
MTAPTLAPSLKAAGGRTAQITRTTTETAIRLSLTLDGRGEAAVSTGIGFLDHMLTLLAAHAGFDLALTCEGDLAVDDHHTAEDCAISLGRGLDAALGDRSGLARYGDSLIPMDESLARCAVDLVTRPCAVVDLGLKREMLGTLSTENILHFFRSLAAEGRFTFHLDVLRGKNDHHRAEAAFKAFAAALRQAVSQRPAGDGRPASTKGIL